jgi:penicillin-insensitive murein endopeptidase
MPWALAFMLAFLVEPVDASVPDGSVVDAVEVASPRPTAGFDLRWSRVRLPMKGAPRSIGQPGAGCVQGAATLPLRGPGFVVVHPERHREFGHPSLIAFIRAVAVQARKQGVGPLLVGDLGQARGGPTPTGHRSHQSGLDVDLWYRAPVGTSSTGKYRAAPTVVDLRTKKMLPTWSSQVASLVELAAKRTEVDRIFVHPSVKRALCQDKDRRGPWLERVRPWWGHHDHFHVRLRCPSDSPDCEPSQTLPAGDGCGAALDWWFSSDAVKTAAKRGRPGENAPAMPEPCEQVLEAP